MYLTKLSLKDLEMIQGKVKPACEMQPLPTSKKKSNSEMPFQLANILIKGQRFPVCYQF